MIAKFLLPALAAVAVLAKDDDSCTSDTFTINSNSDLSKFSSCSTLKGNVKIGNQTDDSLDFGKIQKIDGDLTVQGNPDIKTLKGDGLASITGTWELSKLTGLNSIEFPNLKSVKSIVWVSCTALDTLDLNIETCDSVQISDTHLHDLDGFNMKSVSTLQIDNNNQITMYDSKLNNVTSKLTLNANGLDFKLSFPQTRWIANMEVSNVSSFAAPSLESVNDSMRFDSNYFKTFIAPNLTTVGKDISFVSNPKLENISFPALTTCKGGLTIANNTQLTELKDLPNLKKVGGAVALRGNWSDIALPSLGDVSGTFDVESTDDVKSSCDTLKKLAPKSQGGNDSIQGKFTCNSNNSEANSDTSSGGNGKTSGSSGKDGNDNAAAGTHANMVYIFSATVLGLALQALL